MTTGAARRVALAAQGLAGPRPRPDHQASPAQGVRHDRDRPDRLGQRPGAHAGATAVRPPRPAPTHADPRCARGRRTVRDVGARGVDPAGTRLALVRWRMEQSAAGEVGSGSVDVPTCSPASRRRSVSAVRSRSATSRACAQQGHVVGLGRDQARCRATLRDRRAWGDPPTQRLRPSLRPARAAAAPEVHAAPALGEHEARKESLRRRSAPGSRHLQGSRRLLPHQPHAVAPALRELVDAGDLIPVAVEGWKDEAYLTPTPPPRAASATTLLSPFDSLVWNRDRTAAVRLRLPPRDLRPGTQAPLRLLRAAVPARRSARWQGRSQGRPRGGRARAGRAHRPDLDTAADRPMVAEALIGELQLMAGWLGLGHVAAVRRGTLAAELHRHGLDEIAAAPALTLVSRRGHWPGPSRPAEYRRQPMVTGVLAEAVRRCSVASLNPLSRAVTEQPAAPAVQPGGWPERCRRTAGGCAVGASRDRAVLVRVPAHRRGAPRGGGSPASSCRSCCRCSWRWRSSRASTG